MDLSVATFLVVMLCKVDHIISTDTYDDRHPGLLFDNYPGYILSLPANTTFKQMSTKVPSKMDCVLVCTREPWCRSVNFKITAERDLRHICELIGTEKYTSHKHLQKDDKFTHLSVKNPCEDKPCLNEGKCLFHTNRVDYRCKCKEGYNGEKCQSDVNECATNPCDANASCNNTRGSYECKCNRGYCGNGKQCTVCAFNSSILSTFGNASYIRTLSAYLDPVLQSTNRSRWIRCWHAATDGWDVTTTFHPQCDNKGPTVTIVRVGRYVFGGYTDMSWTTGIGRYFSSTRSFLYSLYNTNGYNPVKLTLNGRHNQYAIYCYADYGPTFGGGHDFCIYTNAASNTHSYTNLGYTYNTPSICSYGTSTCQSFLAGSYTFSPNDVEVFYETTN